jgi:hypothetical protein
MALNLFLTEPVLAEGDTKAEECSNTCTWIIVYCGYKPEKLFTRKQLKRGVFVDLVVQKSSEMKQISNASNVLVERVHDHFMRQADQDGVTYKKNIIIQKTVSQEPCNENLLSKKMNDVHIFASRLANKFGSFDVSQDTMSNVERYINNYFQNN